MDTNVRFEQLLREKKGYILARCLELIAATYPPETARFLTGEKDQFANPVGYMFVRDVEEMYENLLGEPDWDKLSSSVDSIVRVRSVQDFAPSQAVMFVFLLKKAIRETLAEPIRRQALMESLLVFESKVDRLALLAFDRFMRCREHVYKLRVNEIKSEREHALKLLGRVQRRGGGAENEQ